MAGLAYNNWIQGQGMNSAYPAPSSPGQQGLAYSSANLQGGGAPQDASGLAGGGMGGMSGMGLASSGLGVLSGLANAYLGYKNYKLAKDTFNFNKGMANKNYEANRTKYNNSLARTGAVNDFYGSKNVAKQI